jgi:hypothetical protein
VLGVVVDFTLARASDGAGDNAAKSTALAVCMLPSASTRLAPRSRISSRFPR